MRIIGSLAARRVVLGLCLAGLVSAVSGCDSTQDVTQGTDKASNPGMERQKAREAAYGKAGVPAGKQQGAAKK